MFFIRNQQFTNFGENKISFKGSIIYKKSYFVVRSIHV